MVPHLVFGTKIVRKRLGRHADFCLLCRDFKPFRVIDILNVEHFYYIPLGERKNLGFEFTCESCGLLGSKNPDTGYPTTVRDRRADVESLIAETNPDARRAWSNRLTLEDRIRADKLTPDERIPALSESFLLASALLDQRSSSIKFDAICWLSCLGLIGPLLALLFLVPTLSGSHAETARSVAIGTAVLFAILSLVLLLTDVRRYTRRAVLPVLIRAIRPIRPTEQEIETVFSALRERDETLAKILKPQTVIDALRCPADWS